MISLLHIILLTENHNDLNEKMRTRELLEQGFIAFSTQMAGDSDYERDTSGLQITDHPPT